MAEIKTIYKGESVTLLFTFPALYDMGRISHHHVFIGETEFTGVIDGQTIVMKLKSSDTDRMIGTHRVVLWLDDTTLGLRKPYCGDLVVARTQAQGNTVSVSNISDIIIPIVISETAITVGDVLYNYMKGDPFLYTDFTPEQIVELQKPATDAATAVNEAEALRVTAETTRVENEQGRVTAEGTRQTNTAIAITNANNAATNANTKAGLADAAANNANEKAGLADAAATNANNVANTYAAELALKELKANKQNSLTADGTGTKFPTVDAVNAGLAVRGEKLLVDHTITSNKVFPQVESIDYATTTITFTAPHGVTVIPNFYIHAVFAVHNDYSIKTNYKAIPTGFQLQAGYKIVEIISPTVLRLSNVAAGTVVSIANADAAFVDFSLFHFEMNTVASTIFNIEECQAIRVRVFGKCQHGQPYIFAFGNETTREIMYDVVLTLGVGESNWERIFSVRDGFINSLTTGYGNTFRSAGVARVAYLAFNNWRYNGITYINKIDFSNNHHISGNGTRILIYKII